MTERVNHPSWYGGEDNPYEAIKVIEAWGAGFCTGNALKYLARAGRKIDAPPTVDAAEAAEVRRVAIDTDLKKAAWYLRRASRADSVTPLYRRTHQNSLLPEKVAAAWDLEPPLAHVLVLIYQGSNASAALALETWLGSPA